MSDSVGWFFVPIEMRAEMSAERIELLATCNLSEAQSICAEHESDPAFRDVACPFAVRNLDWRVLELCLSGGVRHPVFCFMLHYAIINDRRKHFALICRRASWEALKYALCTALDRQSDLWFAKSIMQSGFDINPTAGTQRPLLFALIETPLLLDGCDIDYNVRDSYGDNLCHYIVCNYSASVLEFAIRKGVDTEALNQYRQTAWQWCAHTSVYSDDGLVDTRLHQVVLFLAGACLSGTLCSRQLAVDDEPPSLAYNLAVALYQQNLDTDTQRAVDAVARGIITSTGVQICIGLQGLALPALVLCEILQAVFSPWPRIPFHCYWRLATGVKHFAPASLLL